MVLSISTNTTKDEFMNGSGYSYLNENDNEDEIESNNRNSYLIENDSCAESNDVQNYESVDYQLKNYKAAQKFYIIVNMVKRMLQTTW